MKKFILIIAMTIALSATNITDSDFWKSDKKKHVLVSSGIATIFTGTARYYGSSKLESFYIGVGSTLLIGVLKEYVDGKNPLNHTQDIEDMYADTIGAVAGATLYLTFIDIKF